MVATYRKVDSLKNLMRRGLNVHDNVITNNIVEAMDAVRKFGRFTVRTDININTMKVGATEHSYLHNAKRKQKILI